MPFLHTFTEPGESAEFLMREFAYDIDVSSGGIVQLVRATDDGQWEVVEGQSSISGNKKAHKFVCKAIGSQPITCLAD